MAEIKKLHNQYFQVSLTAFYEKVFNYSADLIIDASRDHGFGASHGTTFSWNLMQFWDSNVWAFVCTGSWSPIGKGFQSVVLAYAPGQHWRFEGGPVIYWSGCGTNQGYADKDSILVRIRYEF